MARVPSAMSPVGSLVGRVAEARVLGDLVQGVVAGRGGAHLLEGEAGIGKSALLSDVCQAAADRGCAVFWGAGDELGQAFPLRPVLDAFEISESSSDPRRAEVASLLRATPPAAGVGESDAVAAATQRLLALVDRLCAERPALLVVDDLHWADGASVAVWHRLARSVRRRRLLLLGAMRPLPRRKELQVLRATVGRGSVTRLGPLPDEAVEDLVAAMAGGRPGPTLSLLAKGAAGNPFYLTELIAALARAERLVEAGGTVEATSGAAPQTLREAIWDRLRVLPDQARGVLRAAALLGTVFDLDELATVLGRGPTDLVSLVRDALSAGVLSEAERVLAFRHELIRLALHDELPEPARAAWHFDAASALHEAGASAERVARQLLPAVESNRSGESSGEMSPGHGWLPDWAVDWLIAAAPALVATASPVALRLLRPFVLGLADDDPRRQPLVAALARVLAFHAEYDEVEQLIAQALPRVGDPDTLVDLYDTLVKARVPRLRRLAETLAELRRMMAEISWLTGESRRRLAALSAQVCISLDDLAGAEHVIRPVLAEAAEVGDRRAIATLLYHLGVIRAHRGAIGESYELFDRGLSATEGEPALADIRLGLLRNKGEIASLLDRFDEARGLHAATRELAERTGNIRRAMTAQVGLCELLLAAGGWDEALAEADLPEGVGALSGQCAARSVAAIITLHRGEQRLAARHLAGVRRLRQRLSPHELGPWVLAESLEREVGGDPAAALAILSAGLADDVVGSADAEAWFADTVRLAVDAGDPATAAAITERAATLAADESTRRRTIASHCAGLLAGDARLLVAAAAGYEKAGRPLPRAQALEAAGGLFAGRGEAVEAREAFAAAWRCYAGLRAKWDLARLRARLHRLGYPAPRARARPASGWEALTKTEARVAELVANGLSNTEIAQQLVISPRTVDVHVRRILGKLRLRSRVDVARVAADRAR